MKMVMLQLLRIYFVYVVVYYSAYAQTFKALEDDDALPYQPLPVPALNAAERDASYWRSQAQNTLDEKLNYRLNTNKAKNIIFFLGDGLSVPTITAARIYQGQLNNKTGEEEQLFFETFPFTGLSKTYCTDKQVPDSASTATAYLSGVKSNYMTIGVSAKVKPADCESAKLEENRPSSIVKWAQDAGKATGVVTNTRITHASPAGTYAHVPYRGMESDADVAQKNLDPNSCNFDIARQLVLDSPGKNIKVIMGGGRAKLLPKYNPNSTHGTGVRHDLDLIAEWKKDKLARKANPVYVQNKKEFESVDVSKTDYLLGLFSPNHLSYHLERNPNEPTLSEMTEKAIKILKKDPNGFFLFVEGGQIDFGHHEDQAMKALDETVEFAKAIKLAASLTDESDTLIVVTADHAHTMSMSGYPARGMNILGIYGKSKDNLPYSTLSYANGPGYRNESVVGVRHNLTKDDFDHIDYRYPALVPKVMESHGGDDVAVFARGPWAHLFTGNYEQNYIPIAEAYAALIGPSSGRMHPTNAAAPAKTISLFGIFVLYLISRLT